MAACYDAYRREIELESSALVTRSEVVGMWTAAMGLGSKIVFVTGDAGVGKSYFIESVMAYEKSVGARVQHASLEGCRESELATRFGRFARETVKSCEGSPRMTVCIDDVPAADERAYGRVAKAIGKMVNAGCRVLVSVRPECEGLMDAFGDAYVIDSTRLVARPMNSEPHPMTNLLPKLIVSLRADTAAFSGSSCGGTFYDRAVKEMVTASLRASLAEEDLELRLAMILLGRGTFDDVVRICRHADEEALGILESEAPFFGVASLDSAFRVAALSNDDVLHSCLAVLDETCRKFRDVTLGVADVLARRGQYRRMGIVLEPICDSAAAGEMVMESGVNLVCAGHVDLVARASRLFEKRDDDLGTLKLINSLAVAEVSARREEVTRLREACSALPRLRSSEKSMLRHAAMLGVCRDAFARSPILKVEKDFNLDDEQICVMVDHLDAIEKIIGGKFLECFDSILDNPGRKSFDGIPAALLMDDFGICEALLGEAPVRQRGSAVSDAGRILVESGSGRLSALHSGMVSALRILMGRVAVFPEVEQIITKLDTTGDAIPEAVFLCAAAVADLRLKAYARASVRARRAADLARNASAGYIEAAANLLADAVEAATGSEIGDALEPAPSSTTPEIGRLVDLRRMLGQASRSETDYPIRLDTLSRANCSREILWALNVLMNDCGLVSQNFRELMPINWRNFATSSLESVGDAQVAEESLTVGGDVSGAGEPNEKPVRIKVLGTFSVTINGRELPTKSLGARRGRNLVFALALTRGHSLSKRDAIEMIWGDYDYDTGNQKIYESVCMARKALRINETDEPFILTGRGTGRISLDMSRVSVDVDDFEKCATAALANDGLDKSVMTMAGKARAIYSGGIAEAFDDPSGISTARAEALARLHADAMAAGARAALREGKAYLSSQFSREALEDDCMREDAVISNVMALGVLGRTAEITAAYRRYRDVLLRELHITPSKTVCQGVDEALGRSGSDLTTEEIDNLGNDGEPTS
ncbi:MAG: BTAD domain-containing putative transcriptional regulator [Parafannyhessea sp.]|uniref:AfsR/SARP family transcriptional regulator n=1 Tax=Parafannyhessea sp. TaxID=2847324 RepID=UPI003F07FC86